MKPFSARRRRAGLVALLAATVCFIAGENAHRTVHLRALTEFGATDAAGAAIQPPGDTRAVVLPLASMDAHWWVLHTEQLLAEGRPVRHTARDNPPAGREVHWSSALSLPLAGLAWLIHAVSGLSLHVSLQVAALWIGPALLALVLAALFLLVRPRFGTPAAACLVLALGSSGPFLDTFAVGEADHHGLAATCCLLAVWLLIAAGAGRVQTAGGGASTAAAGLFLPPPEARARRGFAAAGIAGAAALWISAATAIPVLGAIALGALFGGWLARRAGSPLSQARPELWTSWGTWGAGASLVFYALEYLPSHAGLRLEVNHPLHALAWWGGGAWLTRALRRLDSDCWFSGRADRVPGALQLAALLAPPLLVALGGPRFFLLNDPFLWALHHDYIQEFRNLFSILPETGWFLFPVLWLAILPVGWLLWRARRQAPETAVPLALTFVTALAAMSLTVQQVRWQGLAAALLAVLVTTLFVSTRRAPASRAESRLRRCACILIACGFAQYPLLVAWGRLRADPAAPPAERAELATLVVRDVAWALQPRPGEPPPVILSGPTTSTQLAYFGGFRVLGTLYWENLEGLKTAAAIFGADDPEAALRLCVQHGVTHLVLFSWDDFGSAYARLHRRFTPAAEPADHPAAPPLLSDHRIPRWLRPLAYSIPPALGLADQSVQVYEVHPGQTEAEAYFHLGRFLRETGHLDKGLAALHRSLSLLVGNAPASSPPDLATGLATELQGAGDDAAAIALLRHLLASAPRDREARRRLAWLLAASANAALRDGVEALRHAQVLLTLEPPLNWDEVETLALAHAAAGDIATARDIARQGSEAALREGREGEARRFEQLPENFPALTNSAR